MADILTRIYPTDGKLSEGLTDWGRFTRAEMVEKLRSHYEHEIETAKRVLSLSDSEFIVDVVRGSMVQKVIERL